jgi:hypothetical protein
MTTQEKLHWVQHDFISMLHTLPADAKGNWGVMNAQQMVEHMADSTRQANGKDPKKLLTPDEHLERFRSFMLSDKPFKENTKNAELPDIPLPVKTSGMNEAIAEFKAEINDFIRHFQNDEMKELMNPFFGALNYEQWIHLLHKHAQHHAKQFGLISG